MREAGLADRFEVDSAGTGDWHAGERPDARAAPDPYYGGPSGFDLVYEMVHRSCTVLLAELTATR